MDPSIESLIWGVVFVMSLLVHEYGHALTARYFGAEPTVHLEAFGGSAQYDGRGMTPTQHFLITLNGPLFESFLIVFSYALLKLGTFNGQYLIQYFLWATMRINILWVLFNLIPITPLDGGHLMRYFLDRKFGEKGRKLSIKIGLAFVVLTAPFFFYEGLYIFGSLLVVFGLMNLQVLSDYSSKKKGAYTSYLEGLEALNNHEVEKAKRIFKQLLNIKDVHIKHSAIEALAKIYFEKNEKLKAYHLLMKADHSLLKEGKTLLCKLAFEHERYELVCTYSREIYAIEPTQEIALLISQAHAKLEQHSLAEAWMHTASQFNKAPSI